MDEPGIHIDTGWAIIEQRGFKPLARVLDTNGDHRRRHGVDGPKQWTHIYTTVYKMCIQKNPCPYAKDLYDRVQDRLKDYLRSSTLPALNNLRGKEAMLKELGRRWANHKLMVKWVTRTFSYIDRYHVKRNEVPTLEHAGYTCFKLEVFDAIVQDVRKAALNIVRSERDGESVDGSLLKQVLTIFVEMGMGKLDVYTQEWENPFLDDTADFYRRTSLKWAEEDSFPDFMSKADASIVDEIKRATQYLNPQTQDRLLHVYEKEVLIKHQQKMLNKENSGLVALLENNKQEDLCTLFKLYSRVAHGLQPIGSILKNHIQREGMSLVREQQARLETAKAPDTPKTPTSSDHLQPGSSSTTLANAFSPSSASQEKPDFIQSLLSLHDKYVVLVSNCFSNHAVFNRAMKEAFERFVNEQVGDTTTAQLFANYCDSLLNTGGRGAKMSEGDVETELEKLVKLFSYLCEKDVFQEFCRKQLAKRLLLDRSHSDDAERHLISKLKQSCGSHFTSKLEGMITDMNVSKDNQGLFQKWTIKKIQGLDGSDDEAMPPVSSTNAALIDSVEFTVRVLTTGHWPTYSEDSVILPPRLVACETMFREFYDQRTSQRVLRWVHSLGKGTVETTLFGGSQNKKIELHVSTHQLCILLLFNDTDSLTYGEILDAVKPKAAEQDSKGQQTGGDELIKASLVSLIEKKKAPLLVKEPRGREFKVTDKFSLNMKFVSGRKRINIPMPTAKISEEEKEAAHEAVVEDRRHAIEAAIVRVMKQYKTLDHKILVMEVGKLCNPVFKPDSRAIKSRIEELITREYLARSEYNNSHYKYLA